MQSIRKGKYMATFKIALNMEYCRSADMGFEKGLEKAAELGYKYVEPMVHTGWELLSEAGYFHSYSMEEDTLLMKELCDKYKLKVASLSAHSPLMKPEAALPRLLRAIELAAAVGAKYVNTDEGMIKPEWMDDDMAFTIMTYVLKKAAIAAARHKIYICIEPHGIYTKFADGVLKIMNLVKSPWVRVNWDTGNSYIAGMEDPYEALEKVRDYVLHIHAKDIDLNLSKKERGKVTGTPVGCACGEGVVDWKRIAKILENQKREIFLSVECGTIAQAKSSIAYFAKALKNYLKP